MSAKCNKFQANIFNKSKCQNCFRPKEQHSAEALDSNKASRKISKCGYLFVAPEQYNFDDPLDRTRRWQRRFFVLYDDGELTFSVDENVSTIPQGVIDMTKCSDVYDAEEVTSHQYSTAVVSSGGEGSATKVTYFKGTTKEETQRWFDVLVMYPRSNKAASKHRRTTSVIGSSSANTQLSVSPTRSAFQPVSKSVGMSRPRRHTSFHPTTITSPKVSVTSTAAPEEAVPESDDALVASSSVDHKPASFLPQKQQLSSSRSARGTRAARNRKTENSMQNGGGNSTDHSSVQEPPMKTTHQTYRGVRNLKHKNQRGSQPDGMRRSNSMTDLSSSSSSRGTTSDGMASHSTPASPAPYQNGQQRGRSRDNAFDSNNNGLLHQRRHHSVSPHRHRSLDGSLYPSTSTYLTSPHGSSKTLLDILKEDMNKPPPPPPTNQSPKAVQSSRYRRFANIPQTNAIQNYEGHTDDEGTISDRGTRSGSMDDILAISRSSDVDNPSGTFVSTNTKSMHDTPYRSTSSTSLNSISPASSTSRRMLSGSGVNPYGTTGGSVLVTRTSSTINRTAVQPNQPHSVRLNAPPNTQTIHSIQEALGQTAGAGASSSSGAAGASAGPSTGAATSSSSSGVTEPSDYAARSPGRSPARSPGRQSDHLRLALNYLEDQRSKNETDESKMAKSVGVGDLSSRLRNSLAATAASSPPPASASLTREQREKSPKPGKSVVYMKKGWLLVLDSPTNANNSVDDWSKHWFVLSDSALTYYKDSRAEDAKLSDGVIDLTECYSVSEVSVSRNYGFSIKSKYGNYTLSAMTAGIRQNWIQAITKCIDQLSGSSRSVSNASSTNDLRATELRASGEQSHSPYRTTSTSSAAGDQSASAPYSSRFSEGHKSHSPSPSRSVGSSSSSPSKYTSCTWPYQQSDGDQGSTTRSRNNSISSSSSITSGGVTSAPYTHGNRSRTFALTSSRRDSANEADGSTDRSRSPSLPPQQAPSAKIKNKSRSKSPRPPRSPPPTEAVGSGASSNISGSVSGKTEKWTLRKFSSDLLKQHPPDLISDSTSATDMVQTLKSQLNEARQNEQSLRRELQTVQASVEKRNAYTELQDRVRKLEESVREKDGEIARRDDSIRSLRDDLDNKRSRYDSMEKELHELSKVKQRLVEHSDIDSRQRKQLRELEREKESLNTRIRALQSQLDSAVQRENIAGSLNTDMAGILTEKDNTIAELEEKLVESDARIHGLSEDIRLEVDENTSLQQSLEKTCDDVMKLKDELNTSHNEIQALTQQVESLSEELLTVRSDLANQEIVKEHMGEDIESGVQRITMLETENKKLQLCIQQYTQQLQQRRHEQRQLDMLEQEKQALEARCLSLDADLEAARSDLTCLQEDSEIQKAAYEQEMSERYDQLLETRHAFEKLQRKLSQTENLSGSAGAMLPPLDNVGAGSEKYKHAMETVRRLNAELKESQTKVDDLELAALQQQKEYKSMESTHQNQISLMSRRIEDLASKLTHAEKKSRKLEKRNARRNSKLLLQEAETVTISTASAATSTASISSGADGGSREGSAVDSEQSTSRDGSKSKSSSRETTPDDSSLGSEATDRGEQIHSLEHRLGYAQTMLDDCRHKISDLVLELGVFAGSAASEEQAKTLDHIRERLNDVIDHCDYNEPDQALLAANIGSDMRTCAEKLSVEAAVLSEMARLCRKADSSVLCDGEKHLVCIQQASQAITRLQQQITHTNNSCEEANTSIADRGAGKVDVKQFSTLLANKLLLQAQMSMLLSELSQRQRKAEGDEDDGDDDDRDINDDSGANAVDTFLAKECLLFTQNNLDITADHTRTTGDLAASLAPRAVIGAELDFVWNKLKQVMRDCDNSDECLSHMDEQLSEAHERLMERKHSLADVLTDYRSKECSVVLEALNDPLVVDKIPETLCMNSAAVEDFNDVVDDSKELSTLASAESRAKFLVEFLAGRYSLELYNVNVQEYASKDSEQTKLLQTAIKDELKSTMAVISLYVNKKSAKVQESCDLNVNDKTDRLVQYLEVVARKSVLYSRVSYISTVLRDNAPMPGEHGSGSLIALGKSGIAAQLDSEAKARQHLAEYLWLPAGCGERDDDRIRNRLAYLTSKLWSMGQQLDHHDVSAHSNLPHVSRDVVRQAVMQVHLVFVAKCLDAKYQAQIKELKLSMATHGAIAGEDNASKEKIKELEQEIEELRSKNDEDTDGNISETIHDLEEEINLLKSSHAEALETLRSENDRKLNDLTATHRREMMKLRQGHQQNMQQLQKDSAAAGLDDSDKADLHDDTLTGLQEKLMDDRHTCVNQIENMQDKIKSLRLSRSDQQELDSAISELQIQIEQLQNDYEREILLMKSTHRQYLSRNRDEMFEMLAAAETKSLQVDENVIRHKYNKEIQKIKEMYDKGFANMERSHQRAVMELRQNQKVELEKVNLEKEKLLDEETRATQAALDAMKKAHEAEIKRERNKFLDMMSKTYSQTDVRSLQKQHEEDLDLIQQEIRQLTEQYSIKCMENATLEEQLDVQTRALQESRQRVHQLMTRNDELSMRLQQDIEKLNRLVMHRGSPLHLMRRGSEGNSSTDLKIAARIKEAELNMMIDERDNLKDQLNSMTEELEEHMSKYSDLHRDYEKIRDRYEGEIESLKQRLAAVMAESAAADDKNTDSDTSVKLSSDLSSLSSSTSSYMPSTTSTTTATASASESSAPSSGSSTSVGSYASRSALKSSLKSTSADAAKQKATASRSGDDSKKRPSRSSKGVEKTGRALPTVPDELRNIKKNMWRQRQPQRALSVPSIPAPLSFLSADDDDDRDVDEMLLDAAAGNTSNMSSRSNASAASIASASVTHHRGSLDDRNSRPRPSTTLALHSPNY